MLICIDPGKSGGIAFQLAGKVLSFSMPETEVDVVNLIKASLDLNNADHHEHIKP